MFLKDIVLKYLKEIFATLFLVKVQLAAVCLQHRELGMQIISLIAPQGQRNFFVVVFLD